MYDLTLIVDGIGLVAILLVLYLIYLLLFETGPSYRVDESVHLLDEHARAGLLSNVLGAPVLPIDSCEVLNEGQALYAAQVAAIHDAQLSVHLEAYIFRRGAAGDAILNALCARAAAGVQIRVIVDAVGSFRTPARYFSRLRAAGGSVWRYHPLRASTFRRWNNRTHRNLLVIDGTVGFIGGAGIADHWQRSEPAPWRDSVLRVTGPIVLGLQAVFGENWLECAGELLAGAEMYPVTTDASRVTTSVGAQVTATGIVVGSTPTAGGSTRARTLVQLLLATAHEQIDLCSPYFVPDAGIRHELLAARARGVRVRVIAGGPYGDHGIVRRAGRRRYGALLEAGVEIFEYATRMMHSKVLVVDHRWALLGSSNIDPRSFGLNDEVNVVVRSEALGATLENAFDRDTTHSTALDLDAWRRRSWSERVLATLGRVIERHQ